MSPPGHKYFHQFVQHKNHREWRRTWFCIHHQHAVITCLPNMSSTEGESIAGSVLIITWTVIISLPKFNRAWRYTLLFTHDHLHSIIISKPNMSSTEDEGPPCSVLITTCIQLLSIKSMPAPQRMNEGGPGSMLIFTKSLTVYSIWTPVRMKVHLVLHSPSPAHRCPQSVSAP